MLALGAVAPEFTVALASGATFALAGCRGKSAVVLYFFPKAFTRG